MLLEKLKAGVKNSREVDFHGTPLKTRILSEHEIQQSRIEANEYAEKTGLDEESLYVEIAIRQLYLSLSDTEGNEIAANIDSFRKMLTRSEREYLIDEYLSLEKDTLPSQALMSQEEFDQVVEDAKKNAVSILSSSNTDTLRRLIRYLESQQQS